MSTGNNTGQNGSKSPDQLEHEVADARHSVDRTLSALERSFSPGQILDQSMNLMREHGGEFAGNLGRTVKQNPIPLLLTSVGIAWLASSTNKPQGYGSSDHLPVPRSQAGAGYPAGQHPGHSGASLKDKAGALKDKAGAMASSVRDQAKDATGRVGEGVHHQAESARLRQDDAAHYAQMQSERMGDQFNTMLREQPLVLGGLAIAMGAALGAALPRTRQEDEMLGGKRDELVQQGKQEANRQYGEVRDRVKQDAQELSRDLKKRTDGKGEARPGQV